MQRFSRGEIKLQWCEQGDICERYGFKGVRRESLRTQGCGQAIHSTAVRRYAIALLGVIFAIALNLVSFQTDATPSHQLVLSVLHEPNTFNYVLSYELSLHLGYHPFKNTFLTKFLRTGLGNLKIFDFLDDGNCTSDPIFRTNFCPQGCCTLTHHAIGYSRLNRLCKSLGC